MSIGSISRLNNETLFFPPDDEVFAMWQTVVNKIIRNDIKVIFSNLFKTKSEEYPFCFLDKFIPLALILQGLASWTSEYQISEASISWLIDICLILADKQNMEYQRKVNFIVLICKKWEEIEIKYAGKPEMIDAFNTESKKYCHTIDHEIES